jgi:uncharacterized protein (DUF849 family)
VAETHSKTSQTVPVTLSIIALVIAVFAAGAGVIALRGRRGTGSPS